MADEKYLGMLVHGIQYFVGKKNGKTFMLTLSGFSLVETGTAWLTAVTLTETRALFFHSCIV